MILYYIIPNTVRFRKLRLIVIPYKFRRVVISSYYVYTIVGHRRKHINLFSILVQFFWQMVNKEVVQFIRSCIHQK